MSQQTLHNAPSDDVMRAMLNEIADGYTLNTVCSGREGRPTIGQFFLLVHEDDDVRKLFANALTISTWLLADEIRLLEAEITPENADAHSVRFDMLRFSLEQQEKLAHKLYVSLDDET